MDFENIIDGLETKSSGNYTAESILGFLDVHSIVHLKAILEL